MSTLLISIGERIRIIRKIKGFTQEKLAEETGLKASYVSDIERGERNIRKIHLSTRH
ncbi:MAG: helix-turn-helix transcriptional regulator [Niallia nealsonii]|nr:helix-turn-helix transcriptional regulator [Niallia nealsonii]